MKKSIISVFLLVMLAVSSCCYSGSSIVEKNGKSGTESECLFEDGTLHDYIITEEQKLIEQKTIKSDLQILESTFIAEDAAVINIPSYGDIVTGQRFNMHDEIFFDDPNGSVGELYIKARIDRVRSFSWIVTVISTEEIFYSDGTKEVKEYKNSKCYGVTIANARIIDVIYAGGNLIGQTENFGSIVESDVWLPYSVFWRDGEDGQKKYVQHPNYGFVPKPGTEIISEVRSSGNFNFSDAESFLDQFRIVDEKINSIESDATFAEEVFSYYYHVATLMSPRNGWFFLSTDFNGNDINDAQSFENYVSFLDSVCQQKAKENGIVHWESCGYRGFLDSDDEILKGCCLGY